MMAFSRNLPSIGSYPDYVAANWAASNVAPNASYPESMPSHPSYAEAASPYERLNHNSTPSLDSAPPARPQSPRFPIDPVALGIGSSFASMTNAMIQYPEALIQDEWKRNTVVEQLQQQILSQGMSAGMWSCGNTFPSGNGVGASKS